jgi:hypothetical protein
MPLQSADKPTPKRMRKALQELITSVVVNDCLANDGAKRRHALSQPRRNPAAVERKISAACSIRHIASSPVGLVSLAERYGSPARC